MDQKHQAAANDAGIWNAMHAAVHVETLVGDNGVAQVSMLRHPTDPYVESVEATDAGLDVVLQATAQRYVGRVAETAASLGEAAAALREACAALAAGTDDASGFGWLNIAWGGGHADDPEGSADPRLSFWVRRTHRDAPALDRSLVLLAGNRAVIQGRQVCAGLSIGLRVVMHVGLVHQGTCLVRVTGLSVAGLSRAALPPREGVVSNLLPLSEADAWLGQAQGRFAGAFGFDTERIGLTGALLESPDNTLTLAGSASSGDGPAQRVYAWLARYRFSGSQIEMFQTRMVEQVTHMAAPESVFGADPASLGPAHDEALRRPSGRADKLAMFRSATIELPDESGSTGPTGRRQLALEDPAGELLSVLPSRAVHRSAAVTGTKTVPGGSLDLRSDDLAAVHAYARGVDLFRRMETYGLPPRAYFKLARLPLLLGHRALFSSAPDGFAVNAQVRPRVHRPPAFFAQYGAGVQWPQLEVAFGFANLSHRPALPNDAAPPRARAQGLGLAADPRWAWHEFGHVLLYAATGVLEFRFAHSAGDALAAIATDPHSELAKPAPPGDSAAERMRLLTFPWVRLTRSHGRRAALGWCWCGRRSVRRHKTQRLPPRLFSDYFEEQLMSSSLFTLYGAIGGHPGSNPLARRGASHYSLYLVMRAMALLGPDNVVPALTVDQFVSALIDADVGTGVWSIDTTTLGETPPLLQRMGGTVHKVVRWAFEKQGLYASDDPGAYAEGEGRPPKVDIHVPRLHERADGGYAPVALDWSEDPATAAPAWHADPGALWLDQDVVHVAVGNRGVLPADGVNVTVWVAPVASGASQEPLQWQPLQAVGPHDMTVGPQATVTFRCQAASGTVLQGSHLVLAMATCLDDRANLDPKALLACSTGSPPEDRTAVIDLVSNDNNLALRAIDFA